MKLPVAGAVVSGSGAFFSAFGKRRSFQYVHGTTVSQDTQFRASELVRPQVQKLPTQLLLGALPSHDLCTWRPFPRSEASLGFSG